MVKGREMKKFNIFENFIFVCIILVIVQTFLDDLSVMQNWTVKYRNLLLVSGFVFDLIFTIEFLVRSITSSSRHKFIDYFWYKRGWVDLLSSVPLLLLNSGPALYIFITGNGHNLAAGIGVLNVLKVIKAIRVTRILRLVRIIKIFGKIHNTESPMAQHHTSTITTNAVFSIILALLVSSLFFTNPLTVIFNNQLEQYKNSIDAIYVVERDNIMETKEIAHEFFKNDKTIIRCTYKGQDIFPFNEKTLNQDYTHDDFQVMEHKDFIIYASLKKVNAQIAFLNLRSFFMIIVVVLVFSFLYTKHFAQSISDILHILNLGMRKKDYNLQIKINEHYADHEVNKLAQFYNEAYLPAKMKKSQKDKEQSLTMKDLLKFNS